MTIGNLSKLKSNATMTLIDHGSGKLSKDIGMSNITLSINPDPNQRYTFVLRARVIPKANRPNGNIAPNVAQR